MPRTARWVLMTLAFAAIASLACDAVAQSSPNELFGAHAAVCRINNESTDSQQVSSGSGVLIAKRSKDNTTATGVVLTCAHIFGGGEGKIVVHWHGKNAAAANLIGIDFDNDLAALAVVVPREATMASVAPGPAASVGDTLYLCGYGEGPYQCTSGTAAGYASMSYAAPGGQRNVPQLKTDRFKSHGDNQLAFATKAMRRPGDSGGPVFDKDGQIQAILWGGKGVTAYGSYQGTLNKFVNGLPEPFAWVRNRKARKPCDDCDDPPAQPQVPPAPQPPVPVPPQPQPQNPTNNAAESHRRIIEMLRALHDEHGTAETKADARQAELIAALGKLSSKEQVEAMVARLDGMNAKLDGIATITVAVEKLSADLKALNGLADQLKGVEGLADKLKALEDLKAQLAAMAEKINGLDGQQAKNAEDLGKIIASITALQQKSGTITLKVDSSKFVSPSYVDVSLLWAMQQKYKIDHIILVEDTRSDRWKRMGAEYEAAKKKFAAIELFDVSAENVEFTDLPQLVVYPTDGGNPLILHGTDAVSKRLQEIIRDF